MTIAIALLLTFAGRPQGAPAPRLSHTINGAVVISDDALHWQDMATVQRMPIAEFRPEMTKRGLVEVDDNQTGYFFAPNIWQQARIDQILAIYPKLELAIKGDGTVDLSSDPDLRAFVASMVDVARADFSNQSSIVASVQRTYTFQSGSKSISLKPDSLSEQQHKQIESNPLPPRQSDPAGGPATAGKTAPALYVGYPTSYHFYYFGTLSNDHHGKVAAQHAAIDLADKHIADFFERRKTAMASICKKISGLDASKLTGLFEGVLPGEVQKSISGALGALFGQYGFASKQDALDFLNSATLVDVTEHPTLWVGLARNSPNSTGGVGVGIP